MNQVKTVDTVDKMLLERIAKEWKVYTDGDLLAPQSIMHMLHWVDVVHGRSEGHWPDHWSVQFFWDRVEKIGLENIDVSPNPDRIAISLSQFRDKCRANGLGEPPINLLRTYLKESKNPAYIENNIPVKSRKSGKRVVCWLFHPKKEE